MSFPKSFLSVVVSLLALASGLEARNVFVMPGGVSTNQTVSIFSGEPFVQSNTFQGSPASLVALSNPAGTRYFVVASSGSSTVTVLDGSYNVLQRFDLLNNGTAGAVSPDGRRLLVTAGNLFIFDITGGGVTLPNPVPVNAGSSPIDVAVSMDSSRAFVLSPADQRLVAVDLATNSVLSPTLSIGGQSTGVAVGPNGLVYVTTVNRLYEIDGRTMTLTRTDGIPVIGRPGKLAFTPDGRYALAVNQTPVAGNSCLMMFDLVNKTLAGTITNFGVVLDAVVAAGNSRAFATSSQNQTLYDISVPGLNITVPEFGAVGSISNVIAAVASNEAPQPKFLYVVAPTSLYQIDLPSNTRTGQLGLVATPGGISFAGPASTNPPTNYIQYHNNQTMAPAAASLPLVVRVLDSTGRPVFNTPVVWTPSIAGASIQGASAATNAQGFAQATVVAPTTTGTFTVNAGIGPGAGIVATFTLTVSGGTVTPGTGGGISIVSGHGQIVREYMITTEPLVVQVRDTAGNPVPTATVEFAIATGQGTLSVGSIGAGSSFTGTTLTVLTDANGQASANFLGSFVSPGYSYQQSTVRASTGGATVDFIVTTTIAALTGGTMAPDPTVALVKPTAEERQMRGQAGETLAGAIVVSVAAAAGPQAGQAIPNVGVRVTTGLDPALSPSASCAGGTVLTDGTGTATCNLVVGPRVGVAELSVITGGFNVKTLSLTVVPGPPSALRIIQGNNQSGNPGQIPPLALVAEVTDAGGNQLSGVAVTWEVVTAGTLTLRDTYSTSDLNGRVSTRVTLGGIPGTHQVRARVASATATFNLTVNVTVAQLLKVSGDGQTAFINQAFAQPLVVQVNDQQGRPVTGIPVTFSVAGGSATVGSATATTDSQGRASTTVQAGGAAGPIAITASVSGFSVSFSLSSRVPGPVVAAAGFVNAASAQQGVVPGSIVTIQGSGLAQGIQGCVEAGVVAGPLPTTLAGVAVSFGTHLTPIFHVCNVSGREQVTVQAPWELGAGSVPVQITVGSGSSVVQSVPVLAAQPGIFETQGADGRRYAVIARPNGTFVTPLNPAVRGELIRIYVTGLGPVLPLAYTNQPGVPGQEVYYPLVVGVNNAGVRVVSAEYAQNMIGVYVVTIELPADTTVGLERSLDIVVQIPDGRTAQAAGSRFAIQ
ncbi:MAG: Ig-like domain-containing protein [Acidobacteriota bacterium]